MLAAVRTRSACVAIAAVLFAACSESTVGERTVPANESDAPTPGDAATPDDAGVDAQPDASSTADANASEGGSADASSDADSPINTPFGPCEPQPLSEVCAATNAGCACAWSNPELLSDTLFGYWDYAVASDGLGGALVLYTSTSDGLARLLRFDPAREAWGQIAGAPPVLPRATLVANGCGRAMLAGVEASAPNSALIFTYDVPSSAWSAGWPTGFSVPLIFHMNPRGNAVVLMQNTQTWAARVFEPVSGDWGPSHSLGMSIFGKAGAIDTRGDFADAWNTVSRLNPGALYVEWYDVTTSQWSPTPELQLSAGGASAYPVFDAQGGLHAIWSAPSTSGGSDAIWIGRIDRAAYTLVGAAPLSSSSGSDQGLSVASTPQGTAVAAWGHQLGSPTDDCWTSGCEILASTFDGATGTWSAPQPIGTNASSPQTASAANGNAVVLWYPATSSGGGTATAMRASYFAPSGGWSAPDSIAPLPTLVGFGPSVRIVMNDRGDAFVFWMDQPAKPTSSDARELWSARRTCRTSAP